MPECCEGCQLGSSLTCPAPCTESLADIEAREIIENGSNTLDDSYNSDMSNIENIISRHGSISITH